MRRYFIFLPILLVLPWALPAGEPFKPGKLPKDVVNDLRPGMVLTFLSPEQKVLDQRVARLAALHVPPGEAPSPFLPSGPFQARLQGLLKVPLKGDHQFVLEGTGQATLQINGQEILKLDNPGKTKEATVELSKGYNLIQLNYASPAKGDATVRVSWAGEGFAWEPLPPDALFHRGKDPALVKFQELREGRLLFARLACVRCHELPGKILRGECAMPEMQMQGPLLTNAGQRFNAEWLLHWLQNPRHLRPDAAMPNLHLPKQDCADLAAYLGGLAAKDPLPATPSTPDAIKLGGKLFANLGCIACHSIQSPKKEDRGDLLDELGRLSLYIVNAKFRPGALEAFLRQPHAHNPWIRMPDFKLSAPEAAALTAYLGDQAKGRFQEKVPAGDNQRGAKLFASAGCVQCHPPLDQAVPAAKLRPTPSAQAKGCLASEPAPRGTAPDFGFTTDRQAALIAFLKTDGSSLKREAPAEFAQRQVHLLQCQACHRRDGALSRWHTVLEEEGATPEFLPTLTWIGEKLKPEWTAKLLSGQHDQRARPWLKARMPAFPARADMLSLGLSHDHGYAAQDEAAPPFDADLAAVGKKLLPQQGGFNCVMCHAVGSEKAIAPFEAPGINLLDAALRLRYPYYPRWMLDPPRVDITTRMPKLSMDGKTTALKDVLDGDAHRQFDAIWHHLQTLPKK